MTRHFAKIGRDNGHGSRFLLGCTLVLAMCGAAASPAAPKVEPWGTLHDGTRVERVSLQNERGMKLSYIDYGATIVAVEVPDRQGKVQNVALSLPELASYERSTRRFGAIIGRYAGRIANAHFTLDGRSYELVPALKGNAIHGDPDGFDRRVWQRRDFSARDSLGSTFHMISPDGDQKMPGQLEVSVTYRLYRKRNEFRIEYEARTDAPTVINLTNHCFYNLAGAGSSGLAGHVFKILADRYAETDARRTPTGALLPVADTPLDFQREAGVTQRLAAAPPLLGNIGIDHSLLLQHWNGKLALAATIVDTGSGRRLELSTTEPSVQFNTGNGFDGSEIGSEGRGYQHHDGFALETQHLPDSPNHANFPSTVLLPGQVFHSVTSYRFSTTTAPEAKND
ncbi:MAG: galactose mutarotase [Burkholderiaceae bacterium]|nr:galactose mutarotase [Burkholderiaceae bacterium]